MFQENCFVVSDDTKEGVIIDCGAYYEEERAAIRKYVETQQIQLKHLLLTHAHIDHCFGNNMVFKSFGLSPELCTADVPLYNALKHQASIFCGIDYTDPIPAIGKLWDEGEIIKYGTHSLQVRCTPGHTPGSVFLYDAAEGLAFSGDTLFRYSIGRTDFEGGSFEDIDVSLHQVVAKLPPETVVLTGHGGRTKIKDEILNNPYLQ